MRARKGKEKAVAGGENRGQCTSMDLFNTSIKGRDSTGTWEGEELREKGIVGQAKIWRGQKHIWSWTSQPHVAIGNTTLFLPFLHPSFHLNYLQATKHTHVKNEALPSLQFTSLKTFLMSGVKPTNKLVIAQEKLIHKGVFSLTS